ncbi:hypothetical protein ALQ93_102209 [Pseudomonas syringae pv. pisi]|uniref:Uncharacterized protein n=1 Tax=Pseudomonas savastanoi pv. phaseolicola TaxID=319 RepID=A0A7Z6US75_PSESH|nr:hypothetical protein ALQ93_102209 [Pseudomonas syringae pv. pisi]RML60164.1 hypothetical protein ALQ92_101853 [Pseudomonas syringae pv. pisi]RMM29310.1 hypothetical protein ALQ81_101998 [Pseudomonas syringae pv. pisi]RMM50522.1 hypothetical protein ALQ76_102386 [Pseudomonas syringae pv. atrofaciens]RMU85341.1 hypothetical protein ALP21_101914 [Pseudomonas savastanoi pv. phaseolicola]
MNGIAGQSAIVHEHLPQLLVDGVFSQGLTQCAQSCESVLVAARDLIALFLFCLAEYHRHSLPLFTLQVTPTIFAQLYQG